MLDHTFKSNSSHDQIDITYSQQNHRCNFITLTYDRYSDHIDILNQLVTFLSDEGITWVSIRNSTRFTFPPNTVSYEKGHFLNVHVEDFSNFYKRNLPNIVKSSQVYVDKNAVDEEGWTRVVDPKKERSDKLKALADKTTLVQEDWNTL